MTIIVCPGIHEKELTDKFVMAWKDSVINSVQSANSINILICPVELYSALSGFHILQFLHQNLGQRLESPVIFVCFSAGVVGAIAAASSWQLLGGKVKAFIAIDGWGVPLWGNFPIHRMSHDYFTHWSSKILGSGENNFYADPAVDHLEMWRSPQKVQGWWVDSSVGESLSQQSLTAAEFLHRLLVQYEEN
ncbi:hypothetical protein [Fischerella thermalis]|uniref:Alpha/beta hydrolase n=1 Tax=Fischerella thermalis CCMEE 5318 TaxID=2019666 RepID=A0A2N6L4H5_9CYAN|nr:hypothetical protein [Fischerella thermalis]PMB15337.1 hypothetical protein CEN46_25850 [Fischerella thermalis CCMEE 5318]PMB19974.1 hypothetical protein CEN47_22515 [Fischerella thermalis CCMEE 5319]